MPGVRGKIRKRDTSNPFVDSDSVIPGTLEIGDLKKIDSGDSTGVNAETLPYDHTALTPTIHDKIASIIGLIDFTVTIISVDGINNNFVLANPIDTSQPYLVWFNGEQQNYTDDYTFPDSGHIQFTYIPEAGLKAVVFYGKL